MAEYKIVDAEQLDADLTEIANEVRTLADTSDKLTIDQMKDSVAQANADIEAQTDIVSQIMAVLGGKLVDSDSAVLEEIKRIIDSKEIDSIEDSVEKLGIMKESIETATGESYEDLTGAVKGAIDKAGEANSWYEMSKIWTWNFEYMFRNARNIKKLPRLDFSKATSMQFFINGSTIEEIDYYIDSPNVTSFYCAFGNTPNLKRIVGVNTSNCTNFDGFLGKSAIEIIEMPLDTSKTPNYGASIAFGGCNKLREIRFVEGSIKWTLNLASTSVLSAESIQSVINGLATVENTQTITFHTTVKAKLTEEQITTITNKNWTLA